MSDTATPSVPRPGALPSAQRLALAAKDKTLTSPAAVELARAALEEASADGVGEHLAATLDEPRLVTHLFACTKPGYRGWHWAVTLSRPPRGRTATVCEMGLLPGDEALLAPAWVPWAERLEPGDLGRSDRLPRRELDERLEPGWEATGQDADAVALDELDLGRARVLSAEGVSRAAQRWYDGEHGPRAEGVRAAHATCSTCGFFLPMAGAMRAVFGVCANEWAADDGSVVSLDHGCGAHSETDVPDQGPQWPITPSRVDDHRMEAISTGEPHPPRIASSQDGPADDAASAREAGGAADDRAPEAPDASEGSSGGSQDAPGSGDSADSAAPADSAGASDRADAAEPAAQSAAEPATQAQPHADREPAVEPRAGRAPERDAPDPQPREPGSVPAEAPQERAASAREAVADLARSQRPAAGTTGVGPMTLADLEAGLPQR